VTPVTDVAMLVLVLVALATFIGSVLLFRRDGAISVILMLVGSAAYVLWRAMNLSLVAAMQFVLEHQDSRFVQMVWPVVPAASGFLHCGDRVPGRRAVFPRRLSVVRTPNCPQHLTRRCS
jgi:hypothetical protein